jgi:hypothetical protein
METLDLFPPSYNARIRRLGCQLVTGLETLGTSRLLVLMRVRRVVWVTRRVWPSGQMMEAKGKVEMPDELEAWRIGPAADQGE